MSDVVSVLYPVPIVGTPSQASPNNLKQEKVLIYNGLSGTLWMGRVLKKHELSRGDQSSL